MAAESTQASSALGDSPGAVILDDENLPGRGEHQNPPSPNRPQMGAPDAHRIPKEIPARPVANPMCKILLEASENPNITLNSSSWKLGK